MPAVRLAALAQGKLKAEPAAEILSAAKDLRIPVLLAAETGLKVSIENLGTT